MLEKWQSGQRKDAGEEGRGLGYRREWGKGRRGGPWKDLSSIGASGEKVVTMADLDAITCFDSLYTLVSRLCT